MMPVSTDRFSLNPIYLLVVLILLAFLEFTMVIPVLVYQMMDLMSFSAQDANFNFFSNLVKEEYRIFYTVFHTLYTYVPVLNEMTFGAIILSAAEIVPTGYRPVALASYGLLFLNLFLAILLIVEFNVEFVHYTMFDNIVDKKADAEDMILKFFGLAFGICFLLILVRFGLIPAGWVGRIFK